LGASGLTKMQHICGIEDESHSPGRIVFPQHPEDLRVIERISPASDDGQQLLVGAEPFHGGVDLGGNL
jgi:hypothetical protein